MTSGTVPSPPEASTRGAGIGKRAGQGVTARIRTEEQYIPVDQLRSHTSEEEAALVQLQRTGEPKPDSPARAQDDVGADELEEQ